MSIVTTSTARTARLFWSDDPAVRAAMRQTLERRAAAAGVRPTSDDHADHVDAPGADSVERAAS